MTWTNPRADCALCEMDEQTVWYHEDEEMVICETLDGSPMVVLKEHTASIDGMQEVLLHGSVESVVGDCEFDVRMNHITDHWHAHLLDSAGHPLQVDVS